MEVHWTAWTPCSYATALGSAVHLRLSPHLFRTICVAVRLVRQRPISENHWVVVEFYRYPTVITALIHLVKPELIR